MSTKANMEETHPTLKQTPKLGLFGVPSNNSKLANKTRLVKAKTFEKALEFVNEKLSFKIKCFDGSEKQVKLSVKSLDDLTINHKADSIKNAGVIKNVRELRRLFTLQEQMQTLSGSFMGESKRGQLNEFLQSERKNLMVQHLRNVALNLNNYQQNIK